MTRCLSGGSRLKCNGCERYNPRLGDNSLPGEVYDGFCLRVDGLRVTYQKEVQQRRTGTSEWALAGRDRNINNQPRPRWR